jgi:hypothetical protein
MLNIGDDLVLMILDSSISNKLDIIDLRSLNENGEPSFFETFPDIVIQTLFGPNSFIKRLYIA